MENFIHNENLKLFRQRLAESTSEKERKTIQALIEEEEKKEAPQMKVTIERDGCARDDKANLDPSK
ncbi:MAG: hypothetical protein K2X60_05040 [Xanthobacteraceae bacterium]|nr:hypothetical protein [Xanthobacteraceae bacterium]